MFFTIDKEEYQPIATVEGVEKVLWIERYRQGSEFIIIGDPLKLMTLPKGSFISHDRTNEVMIVEDLQIFEDKKKTPRLKITGRGVAPYIMGHRVVTHVGDTITDWDAVYPYDPVTYNFANLSDTPQTWEYAGNTWDFVEQLLTQSLVDTSSPDYENLPNCLALVDPALQDFSEVDWTLRYIEKMPVLADVVYKILEERDLGVKFERPGPERSTYNLEYAYPNLQSMMLFVVHFGRNLYDTVTLDYNGGDRHKARYMWSDKELKNAFYSFMDGWAYRDYLLNGERSSEPDPQITGWNCRVARVETPTRAIEDLPGFSPFEEDPTGLVYYLQSLAEERIFASNSQTQFVEASGSRTGPKYGQDYNIGDIVKVYANYGVSAPMRVIESAMAINESGEDVITTLAPPYPRTIQYSAIG